jgi:Uma2 family endonuclease
MMNEKLLTAEEYYLLNGEDRTELVRGRVSDMMSPGHLHGLIALRVGYEIESYLERTPGWGTARVESGFITERKPDTVRLPDVSFVRAARNAAHPQDRPWLEKSPDLAVEVRSPYDTLKGLFEKAEEYLMGGAQLVWIVDPEARRVHVFGPEVEPATLSETGVLSGGEVLPGFELRLSRLFRP